MTKKTISHAARSATPDQSPCKLQGAARQDGRAGLPVGDQTRREKSYTDVRGDSRDVSAGHLEKDPQSRDLNRLNRASVLRWLVAFLVLGCGAAIAQFIGFTQTATVLTFVTGLSAGCTGLLAWTYWQATGYARTPVKIAEPDAQADLLNELDEKIEAVEDARWQLDERVHRYRDLLDQHQDIIIRLDAEGHVTFANQAFCRMFELRLPDIVGENLSEKFKDVLPLMAVGAHAGSETQATCRTETEDGPRWIAWHGKAIATGKGLECQYDGRDVTDEVQMNRALKDAKEAAEQANLAKSRFLASMSHEIRTPMNGILGMTQLLRNEELSRQQTTYVDAIKLSARNLLTIIDEILDYSKIEAGRLILADRAFSVTKIVQSVVELLAPGVHEKGLELAWTVHPDANKSVIGDPARVRQILLNLVSNAMKFTDEGGIRVIVECAERRDGRDPGVLPMVIRVTDTGIGLSKQEQSQLFSEFSQTEQALKRQVGGTGLGLAISRRLAEAMDGSLTVESAVGSGSTFVVTLCLPVVSLSEDVQRDTVAKKVSVPEETKVLVAMDRAIERAALADVLGFYKITAMHTPFSEAADVIDRLGAGDAPFTRLLVDDGVDTVQASELLARLSKIAVSHGLQSDAVRGLVLVDMVSRDRLPALEESGFDGYLVRPVRPQALLEQLASPGTVCPPVKEARTDKVSVTQDQSTQPALRFLLVEDNDINALLVEKQLRHAGHHVERDITGGAALSRIRRCLTGREDAFDIILMDVLLPEMDGLEATRKITQLYKSNVHSEHRPPIIALTANAFEEDRQRCLDAGMDDYVAKPFDQDMLNTVLKRCWERRTRSRHAN